MDRRTFFQSLVAVGAPVRRTRKRVLHTGDMRLYHGPIAIPAHVAEAVREDPTPYRASGRGTHLMSRYAEPDGTVYVFRCQIPEHRGMVGEIVRTPLGRMRVHCWSAANPGEYREPRERYEAADQQAPAIQQAAPPILPPLMTPERSEWIQEGF